MLARKNLVSLKELVDSYHGDTWQSGRKIALHVMDCVLFNMFCYGWSM